MFTWVHGLVFAALGGIAARLLAVAERNPSLGFGIVLFFVLIQSGFTTAMAFVAPAIFSVLGWASIFVANLLAAATMVVYFPPPASAASPCGHEDLGRGARGVPALQRGCWARSCATSAVQPVWWLAPSPAPVSPSKYS